MSTSADDAQYATAVAKQFDRMVKRQGGSVKLLGFDEGVIRIGYRPGVDPECVGGICVLPDLELQQLMTERAARRRASVRVAVELMR